jgi:hypothetical protein
MEMKDRIDCEKCLNSEFYDGDKLRCKLKECSPSYEDMAETIQFLLSSFQNSFINDKYEFIADNFSNQYFLLRDCKYPEDIECKVLEWLSRAASEGHPYKLERKNKEYRNRMLRGINSFLETGFSEDEMSEIYSYLGNACNHIKTLEFIKSNYDMNVLKR